MIVKASSFEALWHFITISNILPLQALTTHGWKITQVGAYSLILYACTWDLSTYPLILHVLRMKVCARADEQQKVILHSCSYSGEEKSHLHKICKRGLWLICGVLSFVFVTLVLCWVKLRPYSEYIVILPKCYPSPLHMRLNVKVSNFFDYCLLCSSKFPQFYFFSSVT